MVYTTLQSIGSSRLMDLRGSYNSTDKRLTICLVELMYRLSMYDTPPSVWGTLTSSTFNFWSFITPTPSHFLSLDLTFSVIINKPTQTSSLQIFITPRPFQLLSLTLAFSVVINTHTLSHYTGTHSLSLYRHLIIYIPFIVPLALSVVLNKLTVFLQLQEFR